MDNFITTDEQLKAVVAVNESFDVETLAADLELALDRDVRPLLGPVLLADLLAKQAAQTLSAAEATLVYYLQGAVGNLAWVEYLPFAQVQISQSGVNLTGKTAFEWQIRELRASFVRKGYNYLERALELLDTTPTEPSFATWRTSDAGGAARQYLLNSARDFSEWCNIGSSRLVFNALLPSMRKVEAFDLAPVLGPEFYDELKTQVKGRTLSADNERVLRMYVQPALASLTVAKAVPEIGLSLNGSALELNVYRFDDAQRTPANNAVGAPVAGLLDLKVQAAIADGHRYLQLLRGYLNAQASLTRYATYFTSATYQPAGPRPVVRTAVDSPTYYFG